MLHLIVVTVTAFNYFNGNYNECIQYELNGFLYFTLWFMKITVFILIILIYSPWWEENNQLLINDEDPWLAYIKSSMHPSFGILVGTGQKIPQITLFCSSDVRRNAWAKMVRGKLKFCLFISAAHVRLSMIKFICSNMWYQNHLYAILFSIKLSLILYLCGYYWIQCIISWI
jgi:hypothetical protein